MTKNWTVLVTASLAALLALFAPTSLARADIFEWEYINPANPALGKQQSTTLTPDGAGVDAVPGANLWYRNLSMAYLIGADISGAVAGGANLSNADLSQANATNAYIHFATLTNANLTQANLTNAIFAASALTGASFIGAEVRGADFAFYPSVGGTGITAAQLYSTASYQASDLTGMAV